MPKRKRKKNGSPLDGYELGRPFGNSPRILKKSGAGVHGGTTRQRNKRDRQDTKRALRSVGAGAWMI